MKKIACLLWISILAISSAPGQAGQSSIKDYLDAYIGENAIPFLQPIPDLVSANLHTGVWDWPGMPGKPYVRLKVQGILSVPSESMRTFTGQTTGEFTPAQTATVPTIVGSRNPVIVQGDDNSFFVFPGGYDLGQLILATPQLTIGGIAHTEISGRFISANVSQDIGRVKIAGAGLRHQVTGWWPLLPVNVSVGYYYHHVEAGTYLNSRQHLISLQVGKSFKVLAAYVGAGYQIADTHIDYTYQDADLTYPVHLKLDNQYPLVLEAGVGIRLGPVYASGSISHAGLTTISVGGGLFF